MADTTDKRIAVEEAIIALLETGDEDVDDVRDFCEDTIDEWAEGAAPSGKPYEPGPPKRMKPGTDS